MTELSLEKLVHPKGPGDGD